MLLQPVDKKFPHYTSQGDEEQSARARAKWRATHTTINQVLRAASEEGERRGVVSQRDKRQFFTSGMSSALRLLVTIVSACSGYFSRKNYPWLK